MVIYIIFNILDYIKKKNLSLNINLIISLCYNKYFLTNFVIYFFVPIFRFKNYIRYIAWDKCRSYSNGFIHKKIKKWWIPDSSYKNGFIIKYRIYNKDKFDIKELEDESYRIKLLKKKKYNSTVDIYFKDCFNFYNYVKVPNVSNITIEEKIKKEGLPYLILRDKNWFFNYLFNWNKWFAASFIYENHYRTFLLKILEHSRAELLRDPAKILVWNTYRYSQYKEERSWLTAERFLKYYNAPANRDTMGEPYLGYVTFQPRFYLADPKVPAKRDRVRKYRTRRVSKWRENLWDLAGFQVVNFHDTIGRPNKWQFWFQFKYQDSIWRHPLAYVNFNAWYPEILMREGYAENFVRRALFRKMNSTIPYIPNGSSMGFAGKWSYYTLYWKLDHEYAYPDSYLVDMEKWPRSSFWCFYNYLNCARKWFRYIKDFPKIYSKYVYFYWNISKYTSEPSAFQINFQPWKIVDKKWYKEVWENSWKSAEDMAKTEEERIKIKKDIKRLRSFIPNIKRKIKYFFFRIKFFFFSKFIKPFYLFFIRWFRFCWYHMWIIIFVLLRNHLTIILSCVLWYFKDFIPYYLFHKFPVYGYLAYKISLFRLKKKLKKRTWRQRIIESFKKRELHDWNLYHFAWVAKSNFNRVVQDLWHIATGPSKTRQPKNKHLLMGRYPNYCYEKKFFIRSSDRWWEKIKIQVRLMRFYSGFHWLIERDIITRKSFIDSIVNSPWDNKESYYNNELVGVSEKIGNRVYKWKRKWYYWPRRPNPMQYYDKVEEIMSEKLKREKEREEAQGKRKR